MPVQLRDEVLSVISHMTVTIFALEFCSVSICFTRSPFDFRLLPSELTDLLLCVMHLEMSGLHREIS